MTPAQTPPIITKYRFLRLEEGAAFAVISADGRAWGVFVVERHDDGATWALADDNKLDKARLAAREWCAMPGAMGWIKIDGEERCHRRYKTAGDKTSTATAGWRLVLKYNLADGCKMKISRGLDKRKRMCYTNPQSANAQEKAHYAKAQGGKKK